MPSGGVLRLLWLASPALPIGAYAYSRGLEYAVHAGHVRDAQSARSWIEGVLDNQLATLDAPVLARLYDALQREAYDEVARWSRFLSAARETREMALEDRQLGLGLLRVLRDAGVLACERLAHDASYAALFALACVHFRVSCRDALVAYLFAFVETQITAAIKLVPLGQSAGQRALGALLERIEPLVDEALALTDDQLGAYTPGLALASALHETQYTRLFRS